MTQRQVKQWALEEWNVPYHTTEKYISRAHKENARILREDMKEELGMALAKFNFVYELAIKTKQPFAAIRALEAMMNLGGFSLKSKNGAVTDQVAKPKQKAKYGDQEFQF